MTIVSAKFTENELEYLSKIASDNALYKGDNKELSLGKALKELIKWCQDNKVDINNSNNEFDLNCKKMLEHIHVSIPNLLYLLRLQILFASDGITDEKILHCKRQSIEYLNKICSDFQEIIYKEIKPSYNEFGLQQMPKQTASAWQL